MNRLLAIALLTAVALHGATLRLVPTFENCSVYVEATDAAPASLHVFYQAAGDTAWVPAHPLSASANDPTPRGSLFRLQPDTAYTVRCCDDNGELLAEETFRTWQDAVPIARTIDLTQEDPKGDPWLIEAGGTPDGWVRYVGAPGYVLDGKELDIEAILFDNASYVILEDVTVRGGQRHGINVRNSHHIRIVNCDIAGFGRVAKPENISKGRAYDDKGNLINWDAGVYIDRCHDLVIERCFIHDPRISANSWQAGHPAGPNGIFVNSLGSLVIRWNDIAGSQLRHWNDAIESYGNGKVDGGFNQDADIYGNLLAFANDDAIELDGGQCNVRFYGNRVEGGLCGISTAPNLRGPSYIIGNLVANLGDERGVASAAVKNGGGNSHTRGLTHFYHNTFFTAGRGIAAVGFGDSKDRGMFYAVTRNNLFAVTGGGIADPYTPPPCDYDYDLFARPDGQPGNWQCGRTDVEPHAIRAAAGLVAPDRADFRLQPASPAVAGGTPIPGYTLAGERSDRGALGADDSLAFLPRRPIGFAADAYQLTFTAAAGSAPPPPQVITLRTGDLAAPVAFRVQQNGDAAWFSVTPSAGTLTPGQDTLLTVRFLPEAAHGQLRLAAVLRVALDSGLALPVVVYANVAPILFDAYTEAEALPGNAAFQRQTLDDTARGTALDFARELADNCLVWDLHVPAEGDYYLYFRIRCPEPVPVHDSVFVAVNQPELQRCNLAGSTAWTWASYTGTSPTIHLAKGANQLRIAPRETLFLDAVLVRSTPLPMQLDPSGATQTP